MGGNALVLSAGGLWAAWEVGAWKVLSGRYQPDLIVGASAGSWIGWAIAGGATAEELEAMWLDPKVGRIMQWGVHRMGVLQGAPLLEAARELFERYRPQIPYALTMVEVPSLRTHIVRDGHVTWRHLAASCAIPFGFPPVEIEGRRYVDGGFRGALPLWAAEALGAQSALALNVLNTPLFRALHATMWMQRPSGAMKVTLLEPSSRLGSLRDAVVWDAEKIRRWIELGQLDAQRLAGAAMGAIYQPDRA